MKGDTVKPTAFRTTAAACLCGLALISSPSVGSTTALAAGESASSHQVLDWNQIFIDTLIATNTPNSSSQRLGAIVHTAIFDALNGIERRYTPIFIHSRAPHNASRRAAVVAAAHTALLGLFPSQQPSLDARYDASVAALTERCGIGGQLDGRPRCRDASSAASSGESKWPMPCSVGGRAMGSARATQHSRGARRSASGGRHRRRSDR